MAEEKALPGVKIRVQLSPEDRRAVKEAISHIKGGYERALGAAARDTLRAARVRIVDAIFKDVKLRKNQIFSGSRESPVKATHLGQVAKTGGGEIVISGKRLPLAWFNPKQTVGRLVKGRRVGRKVKYDHPVRGKGRSTIESNPPGRPAFVAPVKGKGAGGTAGQIGRMTVYRRRSLKGRQLSQLRGPSIPAITLRKDEFTMAKQDMLPVFRKNLDSQVDRLLQRRARVLAKRAF